MLASAPMRWLAILLTLALSATAAPTLAILSEPGTGDAAEALAAEIEKQPSLRLIAAPDAPADVEKLAGLLAEKSFTGLGEALHADGLILLRAETVGDQQILIARLIATGPGAVLASHQQLLPLADAKVWAEAAARQFLPLAGKLSIETGRAVPISVLNLRAIRETPQARDLERALTLGLIHRLTHEPAFFVLERERLDALDAQKERYSAAADGFWAGRWLIDGSIGQSLDVPGELTLKLRARQPGGGVKHEFARTCHADQSAEALDAFTRELARTLGREQPAAPWSPPREAAHWLEEARWAAGNELWPAAGAAAESAWALGAREPELIALRVRAAIHRIAAPYLLRPPFPDNLLARYLDERQLRLEHWDNAELSPRWKPVIARISVAEKLQTLETAVRAHQILHTHLDALPIALRTEVATEAAIHASTVLEWFARAEDDARYTEHLSTLRRLIRENVSRILLTSPDPGATDALYCASAFLQPLWHERPQDTLATWQARLAEPASPGQRAVLRVGLVLSLRDFPQLVEGVPVEQGRVMECWQTLIAQLQKSAAPDDRLAGYALHHDLAPNEPLRTLLTAKIRAQLWDMRAGFAANPALFRLFTLFRDGAGHRPPFRAWGLGEPDTLPAATDTDRDFLRGYILTLLHESRDLAWAAFDSLIRPEDYTAAQAATVLAALAVHRDQLPPAAHAGVDRYREKILAHLPAMRPGATPAALKVTRFWHPFDLPELAGMTTGPFGIDEREFVWAEDRLWLRADIGQPGKPAGEFLFSIDLDNRQTTALRIPPLPGPPRGSWSGGYFHITPDAICVCNQGWLRRYDRRAKTWRSYEKLPAVFHHTAEIGGAIYAQTLAIGAEPGKWIFGEILRIAPATGAVEVLASGRRKPAASPLDGPEFATYEFRAGPRGLVYLEGQIGTGGEQLRHAAYDPAAKIWLPLTPEDWAKTKPPASPWSVEPRDADRPARLTDKANARAFPLQFEFDEPLLARLKEVAPELNPEVLTFQADEIGVSLTPFRAIPPGLVVQPHGWRIPGFWLIPRADLDRLAAP